MSIMSAVNIKLYFVENNDSVTTNDAAACLSCLERNPNSLMSIETCMPWSNYQMPPIPLSISQS